MILFALKCANHHTFDSWFRDSATFEEQSAKHLIECPYCRSPEVQKALMAPNIVSREKTRQNITLHSTAEPTDKTISSHESDLKQALRQLRKVVEKNFDYVGKRFAEEARKISQKEATKLGIYGEATAQEVKNLQEEGIEIQVLPWIAPHDA